MVIVEESKAGYMEANDVPFVEELTEEEYTQEMKNQEPELSPEEEKEVIETLSRQNMLKKIQMELDQHDRAAKEGYVDGRYNYAYSEYKTGLKALSDLIVGQHARDDPALKYEYQIRRRKFCVNAAAACIKIHHWAQGLEACTLVLEEGPDDNVQQRKALYRSGVCARGMGELDAAKNFFGRLLEEGGEALDERTRRDVVRQLRGVADERRQYKKFAREMCSEKNAESIILPDGKHEATDASPEELERMAEVEKRREAYLANKRAQKEIDEKRRRSKDQGGDSSPLSSVMVSVPEVVITEDDCISILDTLTERYAANEVQEALKQVFFISLKPVYIFHHTILS
mmetsp:Transcript_5825/g.12804  ORF Transcript_5825/g.12804 Transcript_5825/m.12804 type:complete len:343 (+) Transcript_5825:149-1177(+)